MKPRKSFRRAVLLSGCALALGPGLSAYAGIRIVTYNIDADTGTSTPRTGLDTVLQVIGNEHLSGNAGAIDVLALEELDFTPSVTLQPIVSELNTIYGSGMYA